MRPLRKCLAFALLTLPVCGEEIIRSPDELNAARRENHPDIPFEINGQVVIPANVPLGNFILLSKGKLTSIVDMQTNNGERAAFGARMGDRVMARGRTESCSTLQRTTANCYDLKVLEAGSLPVTPPVSLHDFLIGNFADTQIIALRGTLQDVFPDDIDINFICAVLKDGDDSINLICNCPKSWLPDFRALLGCDVIATGVIVGNAGNKPRYIGPQIRISGTNAFSITRQPCGYPFNAPEFLANNAASPITLARLGPQRLRGTVLVTWCQESFLLKTFDGKTVRIDLAERQLPPLHMSVEVVGIVETDLCDIVLTRASWRPIEHPPTDDSSAKAITLKDLFTSGRTHYDSIQVNTHGKTLTVKGTIKSISHNEDGSRKLLLADGNYTLPVICGTNAKGNPPPEEGCRVAITGVCVKDSDVWRPAVPIPKIRGLFLVTRSDDDIVILQKSPWWTPARFAIAVAVLLAFLVAVFIWNITLRILIDRRSREVIRAQTAKIESELRIDERTRLAADLHDNTVQNLTAIAYRITAAQGALGDREPEAGHILQVATKMLKSCRTSLRQCLWDLRNDALDEPDFETAIRRTVETVAGDAKLAIRFSGRRDLINDTTAHAILNILRELVSNAAVHGGADSVSIAGEARSGLIRFSVRDNGTGFDPTHRPGQDDGHFGLDGIQERLESLNGTIDFDSSVGCGTYVRISISSAASYHPTSQPLNFST